MEARAICIFFHQLSLMYFTNNFDANMFVEDSLACIEKDSLVDKKKIIEQERRIRQNIRQRRKMIRIILSDLHIYYLYPII